MATKTKSKPAARSTENLRIRPLSDRIVVHPEDAEERTAGGIYIPDTAKEKPMRGVVVGVGIGQLLENGKRQPPSVAVGDRVLYGKYSGTEIKVDGVEYTIVREADLLGILEEK